MAQNQGGALKRVKTFLGLDKDEQEAPARRRVGTKPSAPGSAPAKAAPAAPAAPGGGPDDKESEAFQQRLQALASTRDPSGNLVAGKVHLINVNKIRERMGSRWSRFEERVHSVIKAELKRRLTPHDFFTQIDAESYAIVFGECAEAEARLKVALLSEQILEKLFGEAEAKEFEVLGVETLVTKADGSVASQALESAESLIGLLDRAEVTDLDPNARKYQATASGERALKAKEVMELLQDVDDQLTAYESPEARIGAPAVHVDRMRDLIKQLEALDDVIAVEDAKARAFAAHDVTWSAQESSIVPQRRSYDPCAWVEIRAPAQAAIRQLKARAEKQVVVVTEGQAGDSDAIDAVELPRGLPKARPERPVEREAASRGPEADSGGGVGSTPEAAKANSGAQGAAGAESAPPEPEAVKDVDAPLDLDIKYLPMWHASTQKVGLYLCEPKIVGAEDEAQLIQSMPADYQTDFFAIIDRMALRDARQKIKAGCEQGSKSIVVVPVHFSTLHRLGSRRYITELCANMPADHRKQLVWEILGANYETWRNHLPVVTKSIAEFGRAVFLRLHQAHNRFPEVSHCLRYLPAAGISQVGVDVRSLRGAEADSLDLLEQITIATKKSGLQCYGLGFESLSMTICASCLGFQHVSGPAIAEPVTKPDGIQTTAMEAIYGRFAKSEDDTPS